MWNLFYYSLCLLQIIQDQWSPATLWYSLPTTLNFQQLHLNQLIVQKHGVGLCLRDPDLDLELPCAWKCTSTWRLGAESRGVFLHSWCTPELQQRRGGCSRAQASIHMCIDDYLKSCAANTEFVSVRGGWDGVRSNFQLRKRVFPGWVLFRRIQIGECLQVAELLVSLPSRDFHTHFYAFRIWDVLKIQGVTNDWLFLESVRQNFARAGWNLKEISLQALWKVWEAWSALVMASAAGAIKGI